jgi:hypothetical protein
MPIAPIASIHIRPPRLFKFCPDLPNSMDSLSSSLASVNLNELTALSPEVIQRQATINIGT